MPAGDTEEPLLRRHMPELDSIRGLAILVVVVFHGFQINYDNARGLLRLFLVGASTGWAGVALFFVLSGFLITGILLDTKDRPDFYRRFYFRRALRILPLYYAVLLLYAVVAMTGFLYPYLSVSYLTLCFFYMANLAPLFGVPLQYGVLWSLAVEEHFYLVWPTAIRVVTRKGAAILSIGICILCPVLRALHFMRYHNPGLTTYGTGYTWDVADGLAMGACMAVLVRSRLRGRRSVLSITAALFVVSLVFFLVGAPYGIFRQSTFTGATLRQTALNPLFAAMIMGSLLLGTSRWRALVRFPPLRFLGDISYGLYALHILLFGIVNRFLIYVGVSLPSSSNEFGRVVARFALQVSFSIAIAYLSRRYFEGFFLRLKDSGRPAAQAGQA